MFYKKIVYTAGLFVILSFLIIKNKRIKSNKNEKLVGISFGPTGGLFSYQMGIAKYIQDNFKLNDLVFSGISGGCQSSYALTLNIPLQCVFDDWVKLWINDLNNRNYYLPSFYVFDIAKVYLIKFNSKHNLNLSRLNDKMYIGITKIFPYPHSITICRWNNFEDLYDCLKASQYIPFIFGYLFCYFRNKMCTDGFFTNKKYEPFVGRWYHINIYDFKKTSKCKSLFEGIIKLNKLTNSEYHISQFKCGYTDAKKKHNLFLSNGLIEK